jgi:hypothetical protein
MKSKDSDTRVDKCFHCHAPGRTANLSLHPSGYTRLAVSRSQLEEHINPLKVHLTGKCTDLVFNLGELGSDDWEDQKIKKVITSATVPKEDISHSVSRHLRQITFLACVSAAEDPMTPLFIPSTPIRDSRWSRRFRQNEDIMVHQLSPASVNEELFFEYTSNVFISYVDTVPSYSGLETETAILLMDSILPHISPAFDQSWAKRTSSRSLFLITPRIYFRPCTLCFLVHLRSQRKL